MKIAIYAAIGAALFSVPHWADAMPMPAGRCSTLDDGTDQPPPSATQRPPEAVQLDLPRQVPRAHGRLDGALVIDLTFSVGVDGAVASPRVLCSNASDPDYLKALLEAAGRWRFKPVTEHGQARAVQAAYRIIASGGSARAEPIPMHQDPT